MIPKGADDTGGVSSLHAAKLRPISVLPSVARVWARARMRTLMPNVERALLPSMHGARSGKSAKGLLARLLTRLENAADEGETH
eukprot:6216426-Amphidinium_carterae.1